MVPELFRQEQRTFVPIPGQSQALYDTWSPQSRDSPRHSMTRGRLILHRNSNLNLTNAGCSSEIQCLIQKRTLPDRNILIIILLWLLHFDAWQQHITYPKISTAIPDAHKMLPVLTAGRFPKVVKSTYLWLQYWVVSVIPCKCFSWR